MGTHTHTHTHAHTHKERERERERERGRERASCSLSWLEAAAERPPSSPRPHISPPLFPCLRGNSGDSGEKHGEEEPRRCYLWCLPVVVLSSPPSSAADRWYSLPPTPTLSLHAPVPVARNRRRRRRRRGGRGRRWSTGTRPVRSSLPSEGGMWGGSLFGFTSHREWRGPPAAPRRFEDTGDPRRPNLSVTNMDADVPPPVGRRGEEVFLDASPAATRLVSHWI